MAGGILRAVLYLDSPHVSGFSQAEAGMLVSLLHDVFDDPSVDW